MSFGNIKLYFLSDQSMAGFDREKIRSVLPVFYITADSDLRVERKVGLIHLMLPYQRKVCRERIN